MNTMVVAVFLGGDNREPSAAYRVIASSAYEAAKLISDYLGERDPWVRVDVTAVMRGGVEGPPRVIGPIGESGTKTYSAKPAGFFSEPVKSVAAYASGQAGASACLVVRDATCRLFGYHGLLGRASAFTLDHMFGF